MKSKIIYLFAFLLMFGSVYAAISGAGGETSGVSGYDEKNNKSSQYWKDKYYEIKQNYSYIKKKYNALRQNYRVEDINSENLNHTYSRNNDLNNLTNHTGSQSLTKEIFTATPEVTVDNNYAQISYDVRGNPNLVFSYWEVNSPDQEKHIQGSNPIELGDNYKYQVVDGNTYSFAFKLNGSEVYRGKFNMPKPQSLTKEIFTATPEVTVDNNYAQISYDVRGNPNLVFSYWEVNSPDQEKHIQGSNPIELGDNYKYQVVDGNTYSFAFKLNGSEVYRGKFNMPEVVCSNLNNNRCTHYSDKCSEFVVSEGFMSQKTICVNSNSNNVPCHNKSESVCLKNKQFCEPEYKQVSGYKGMKKEFVSCMNK